jgi:hypothetical protein
MPNSIINRLQRSEPLFEGNIVGYALDNEFIEGWWRALAELAAGTIDVRFATTNR